MAVPSWVTISRSWLRTNLFNKSSGLFLLWFTVSGAIAVGVGIFVGSKGHFGAAATGLILTVMAQIADMVEQSSQVSSDPNRVKRVKAFSSSIKLLGIVLLGIGGMVGLSSTTPS